MRPLNFKKYQELNDALKDAFLEGVPTYWYRGNNPNFGDLLTEYIFKFKKINVTWEHSDTAKLVGIGSIIEHLPIISNAIVLGAGCLYGNTRRYLDQNHICAVRGKLTANQIGLKRDVIIGDPGLLLDQIFTDDIKKVYTVGIVPHYVDKLDLRIQKIYHKYKDNVLVIDVQKPDIMETVNLIKSCSTILSSSLHGLVTAISFGIPTAWVKLSNNVLGNGFKFHDFYTAFDKQVVPKTITGHESLQDLQDMCDDSPKNLVNIKINLEVAFQRARMLLNN